MLQILDTLTKAFWEDCMSSKDMIEQSLDSDCCRSLAVFGNSLELLPGDTATAAAVANAQQKQGQQSQLVFRKTILGDRVKEKQWHPCKKVDFQWQNFLKIKVILTLALCFIIFPKEKLISAFDCLVILSSFANAIATA